MQFSKRLNILTIQGPFRANFISAVVTVYFFFRHPFSLYLAFFFRRISPATLSGDQGIHLQLKITQIIDVEYYAVFLDVFCQISLNRSCYSSVQILVRVRISFRNIHWYLQPFTNFPAYAPPGQFTCTWSIRLGLPWYDQQNPRVQKTNKTNSIILIAVTLTQVRL